LILLPAGSDTPIKFEGKVEKPAMVEFLSQVAPPNPDCPPAKEKKPKVKKGDKKASKSSSKFSKASASHKSADASSAAASAQDETVEEPIIPTESPSPNTKDEDTPEPIVLPTEEVKPTIPIISDSAELQNLCLNDQSKTCILAILPKDESSEAAQTAVASLASIHKKHDTRTTQLFPFVGVTASNPVAASLLSTLSLGSDDQVHLIATHGKRAWYKTYSGSGLGIEAIEAWVDAIRMGEGKKSKLPNSLLAATEKPEEKKPTEEPIEINIDDIPKEDPTQHEHNEL
jgi:protein disulfide-isomerase A6